MLFRSHFLNVVPGPFSSVSYTTKMIERIKSLGEMMLSTQLVTSGEKHLLDHNRTYYKLLRRIIAQGQESGELNAETSVNEMVKLYALSERALLYDWFQVFCQPELVMQCIIPIDHT